MSSKLEQIKEALRAQEHELSEAIKVYDENEKNIAGYTSLWSLHNQFGFLSVPPFAEPGV